MPRPWAGRDGKRRGRDARGAWVRSAGRSGSGVGCIRGVPDGTCPMVRYLSVGVSGVCVLRTGGAVAWWSWDIVRDEFMGTLLPVLFPRWILLSVLFLRCKLNFTCEVRHPWGDGEDGGCKVILSEPFFLPSRVSGVAAGFPCLLLQDSASRFSRCGERRERALAASGLCPDPHVGRRGVSGPWRVRAAGVHVPGVCGRTEGVSVQSVCAPPEAHRLSSGSAGDPELGSGCVAVGSTCLCAAHAPGVKESARRVDPWCWWTGNVYVPSV